MKQWVIIVSIVFGTAQAMDLQLQESLLNLAAYTFRTKDTLEKSIWANNAWTAIHSIVQYRDNHQHKKILQNNFDILRVNPTYTVPFKKASKKVFNALDLAKKLYPLDHLKLQALTLKIHKEYYALSNPRIY